MKKTVFTGSGVAIVTPMHEDFSINYAELARLIDFQLENKTDSIIICGTTGEASTLTDEEHVELIEFAVKRVGGRVPVVAGVGSNDTAYALWLTKEAKRVGADALLHVTPYYNKTSQDGLLRHFNIMADATDLPVILYNVPSRTGLDIKPATYKELSKHPNIVAVKEANGNISSIAKTRELCGDDLAIYSGNDDQILPILALGGKGVISVIANIMPQQTHDICELFFSGKVEESAKLQISLMSLIEALFSDINPIPIKTAVNMIGYQAGPLRLPLIPMSEPAQAALRVQLERYGLVK